MPIPLSEWTDLLRREYLEDFIASGGSAVKIAVAQPEVVGSVLEAVEKEATETGYFTARVDSAAIRVQMIHQVFHAVARQVDWDEVTNRWLRSQFNENGIVVPDGIPLHEMDAIAEANDRLKPQLFGEINRLIRNGIDKDYSMAREFRTAVAMLCLGIVNPQNVAPSDADVVKQWLRGDFANLSSLKRLQIYQKIGRHNARLLLSSLAVWLRKAGFSGLVLTVDLNAVTGSPTVENTIRYTRASVLDAYEVLRQCIDDTDETSYFMMVVAAGPGFVDDPRRSVDNYTALKLRTSDEVRDQNRANPLNAMVRLDGVGNSLAQSSTGGS